MFDLHRRALLSGALSAAALPFAARAQNWPRAGFTHNVASGEPEPRAMRFWTRYVPSGGSPARLRLEVAEDASFARLAARAEGEARAENDWCLQLRVAGLRPGRRYHYRFRSGDGTFSPTGRTRTLPEGRVDKFTIAAFSCSNLPFGFFNAYAHAAARDDIDLFVHLGDYTYEYERGRYPRADEAVGSRQIWPEGETISLDDYRQRLATYRADPDLAALHAAIPCITQWDDHELTNDAWADGAQNHQSETEGAWRERAKAATRAYGEWLPRGPLDPARSYGAWDVGDLVRLVRLETRLNRSRQADYAGALRGAADPEAAARAFRDGPWRDPARTMLGAEQEGWLSGLAGRPGARWRLIMQQTLVGWLMSPPESAAWIRPDTPPAVRDRVLAGVLASKLGFPGHMDSWSGYPAAKSRLLASLPAHDTVIVTGDTHNSFAFELGDPARPRAVEFGTTSVSAPGFETQPLAVSPADFAAALVRASPELKWCDTSRRGYLTLTFERDRLTATYHFLETVRERSTELAGTKTIVTERGTNRLRV